MKHKIRGGGRVKEYAYYVKNFAKTLVWKHECDVKLWRHKETTPETNDHHIPMNETPPWKFSAYATDEHTNMEQVLVYNRFPNFFVSPRSQRFLAKHTLSLKDN